MGARHPLPYAYAKAHTLLLEDDGERLLLWAPESIALPALSEVLRLYDVDALERVDVVEPQNFRKRLQAHAVGRPQHEARAVVFEQQRVRLGESVRQWVSHGHLECRGCSFRATAAAARPVRSARPLVHAAAAESAIR